MDSKFNTLVAEVYSDINEELLLETPLTEANVKRFLKKYYPPDIYQSYIQNKNAPAWMRGSASAAQLTFNDVAEYLNAWSPRLQQIIKAAGGNPDIFSYNSLLDIRQIIQDNSISKTDIKKIYKTAPNSPVVFEADKFVVYQPKTWEASRKYFGPVRISLLDGKKKKGSQWCTAASTSDHFNTYVHSLKDKLFYIATKSDDRLFAVRCKRDTSNVRLSEKRETISYILNRYRNLEPNDRQSLYFLADYLTTELRQFAPDNIVKECRDQNNIEQGDLYTLYCKVVDIPNEPFKTYWGFLEFVNFILFESE